MTTHVSVLCASFSFPVSSRVRLRVGLLVLSTYFVSVCVCMCVCVCPAGAATEPFLRGLTLEQYLTLTPPKQGTPAAEVAAAAGKNTHTSTHRERERERERSTYRHTLAGTRCIRLTGLTRASFVDVCVSMCVTYLCVCVRVYVCVSMCVGKKPLWPAAVLDAVGSAPRGADLSRVGLVVNCSGLGAHHLVPDKDVTPIRGQVG